MISETLNITLNSLVWCFYAVFCNLILFIILKRAFRVFLYFTEQTRGWVNNDRMLYILWSNYSFKSYIVLDEWSWEKRRDNMRRDPHKEPLFLLSPPPLDNHTHACKHTVKIKLTASGQPTQLSEYLFLLSTSKDIHAKHGKVYGTLIEGVFLCARCDCFVCFCIKLHIPTPWHPHYTVWWMETPKHMWKNSAIQHALVQQQACHNATTRVAATF